MSDRGGADTLLCDMEAKSFIFNRGFQRRKAAGSADRRAVTAYSIRRRRRPGLVSAESALMSTLVAFRAQT
jgi:hypothetical protein